MDIMESESQVMEQSNGDTSNNPLLVKPKYDEENFYNGTETSPYLVCARSADKNIAHMHPMKLGKMLYQSNDFQSIVKIKSQSQKLIKLHFENFDEANVFVKAENCNKYNIKAFIPFRKTHTIGIVRGISRDRLRGVN